MKAIIIYETLKGEILGGLYEDISRQDLNNIEGIQNVLYYIPLVISGSNYQDRKEDVRNKAIEYQRTFYDFCNYSYGELAAITGFFETFGRRYGLITEFKNEGII